MSDHSVKGNGDNSSALSLDNNLPLPSGEIPALQPGANDPSEPQMGQLLPFIKFALLIATCIS